MSRGSTESCTGIRIKILRHRVPPLQSVDGSSEPLPRETASSARPVRLTAPLAAAPTSFQFDFPESFSIQARNLRLGDMDTHQGVLWKRRDVFKNRWRPRWFILQPDQGILNYYLLTSSVGDTIAASPARPTTRAAGTPASIVTGRLRTTSVDSSITDNTINYDVIPRGTIFLLNCRVSANEALTNVRERLYILTIEPPNNRETKVHLAARSAHVRDEWVRHIASVCNSLSNPAPTPPIPDSISPNFAEPAAADEPGVEPTDTRINESVPTASVPWSDVDDPSDLYANTPDSLKARLEREMVSYLALSDKEEFDTAEWQKLFQRRDGSVAYQKRNAARPTLITARMLDHPVKQVFNLLIDPSRRREYDSNIRQCERMQVLSPHTFLDYYSYNAVWPSSPREFTTVVHWRVVQKGEEKAIALISFSCDEANALKPVPDGHVRASLFVNFTLLHQSGPNSCHFKRILSYELGGGLPWAVSNFIVAQQVGALRAIGDRLLRHESVPSDRLTGPLTRDDIIQDVIQRIGTKSAEYAEPQQSAGDEDLSIVVSESDGNSKEMTIPLGKQAAILGFPLILYHAAVFFRLTFPAIWFVVSVFLAVRQLVLLQLSGEESLGPPNRELLTEQVTCRFKVDLKGVLRFLANKKEDRRPDDSDVSIVHIVARACAVALKKNQLHTKLIAVPTLMIRRYVPCTNEPVSVSLVLESEAAPVTIDNVDEMTVQDVANAVSVAQKDPRPSERIGSCLVLASHNFDDSDIETDATALDPGVSLVAVIGSVALDRTPTRFLPSSLAASPRPVLQLSLTIRAHQRASFCSARRLADEIQKLLLYPEICDDA